MRHRFCTLFLILLSLSFSLLSKENKKFTSKVTNYNNTNLNKLFNGSFSSIEKELPEIFKTLDDCDFDIVLESRSDVTNCSKPNGKLSISSTAGSLNSSYSIKWFNENGNIISTNSQASNLPLGDYVVHVTKGGCTVSKTYTVLAGLPNLSVQAISHVSNCGNPESGHARATLSGNVSSSDKFTITWYGGPTESYPVIKTTSNLSNGAIDNITNLPPGNYAVTVAGTGTNNCISTPSVITINDNRTYPVISIGTPVNNTICSPGSPNGSLTGSVAGGPSGFTFQWFNGQNTLAANLIASTPIVNNLAPGTYTLRVTNNSTSCFSTSEATISDATIKPIVTANIISSFSNCASSNGSVSASVGGSTSGFTFRWYIGNTIKATPDFTGSTYSNLINQSYTVTATNNLTNCVSNPVTITIPDARIYPPVTINSSANTNCAPASPNGSLSATVGGSTTGYTFQWYTGGLPISGSPISSSSTITGRAAGPYSVRVTNSSTGCASTATVTLGDQIITPVVSFSKVDQSVCTPANARITVSSVTEGGAPALLSNYNFILYNADGITPSGISGSPFNGLIAGNYYLEAVNLTTGCRSVKTAVNILNLSVTPVVTFTKVPNSSCDPATSNGSITATATTSGTPSGGGYSYRWFSGGLPVSGSPFTTAQTASSLTGQTYSVEVTDLSSGCSVTAATTLNNAPSTPSFTPIVTAQTSCAPANGSVTISAISENGNSIPLNDYNFRLFGADGTTNTGLTGIPFNGLSAGKYFIEAEHKIRKCASIVEVNVNNNIVLPAITFSKTPNTSCDPAAPNGSLTAIASTGGSVSPGGYSYRWFNGGLPPAGGIIGTSSLLSGLAANIYSVEVTDLSTGCTAIASTSVNEALAFPVLTYAVTPQSNCNPANGSITVTGATENGSAIQLNEYNITLFASDGITVLPGSGPLYNGLVSGTYFIQAVHLVRKCLSAKVEVNILNTIVLPSITFSKINNSSCDAANPNGSITANAVTGSGEPAAGYTYDWFTGGLPVSGPSIANSTSIINKAGGQYSVRITNNSTGCVATASTTINDQPDIPVLTFSKTDQTTCSPANGSINITGVTENSVAMNINDYDFYLYAADGVTPAGIAGIPFNGLAAGRYFVEAEHKIKKCRSLKVEVNIANNTVLPTISFNRSNNFSCDIPNGAITALSTTSSGEPSLGYSFEWFSGGLPVSGIPLSTSATVGNIPGGQYTVRVTNNNSGCVALATTSIIDQPATPVIAVTKTDKNLCTPDNGTIDVSSVSENSIPTDLSDYNFILYAANGTTVISTADLPYVDLAAGNYFVEAEHKIRKCKSTKVPVTILNTPPATTIVLNRINNNSCDAANPNGTITAVPATSGGEPAGGYFYEWFNGGLPLSGAPIGTGSSIADKGPGTYSVRVTNNTTGCIATATININNAPVIPALIFSRTDQTYCTPNGTIDVISVTENGIIIPNSDYDFILYGADGNTNTGLSGIPFTGLSSGRYFLEAQHRIKLCKSIKYEINILNQIVYPVVAFNSKNQSSCDLTNPNGSISATADGFDSSNPDYLFEWFKGGLPITGTSVLLSSQHELVGQAAGLYTLRLTNNITGCKVFQSYSIIENLIIPTVTTTSTQVTSCDFPDGTIEASVNGGSVTDYTFYWYLGNGVKSTPDFPETSHILSGVLAGEYTVVAENILTSCKSLPVNETITESITTIILPTISGIPAACDENGGEIITTATAPGNTGGFEFSWFKGNMDFSEPPLLVEIDPVSSTLSNLLVGYYSVIIKNLNNGCLAYQSQFLPYLFPHEIQINNVGNTTNCDIFDGTIEVEVDPATLSGGNTQADYNFKLYFGNNVKITADLILDGANNPAIFTGLAPGIYTIEAVLKVSPYCQSEPLTVMVETFTQDPALIEDIQHNSFCIGENGSLGIEASAAPGDDASLGYSFTWFDGPSIASPPSSYFTSTGFSSESTIALPAGTYTVLIENIKTQCTFTKSYTIQTVPDSIDLNVQITDQGTCNPLNGALEVTEIFENNISIGLPAHYSFRWYNTEFNELPGNITGNEYSGLGEGTYYIEAVNEITGCRSSWKPFKIENISTIPILAIVQDIPNTSCDPSAPNGTLSATADGQDDTDLDYTFSWSFEGNVIGTSSTVQNLLHGQYTLTVTRNSTGCSSSTLFFLDEEPSELLITAVNNTDSENCDPGFNGETEVTGITLNGAAAGLGDYSFTWYDADFVVVGGNGITVQDLAPGQYYVVARHNSLDCRSEPFSFIINDISNAPDLILVQDAPNSSCEPSAPTGSISATADGQNDSNSDYDFSWSFNGSVIGSTSTVDNRLHGQYSLTVTQISTGCSTTRFIDLQSQPAQLQITSLNKMDSEHCNPGFNGQATVTGITMNGVAGVLADYSYTWYDANYVAFGGNGIAKQDLAPGQYYVVATHNTLNCSSDPYPVTIEDISKAPI
ncbi:hypothetical protein BH23BAC1_BH23BAC1_32690 [soil metagenome]